MLIPLRWVPPALAAIAVGAASIGIYAVTSHLELRQLESDSRDRVGAVLSELRADAESSGGGLQSLARRFAALAAGRSFRALVLVDERGSVSLAANGDLAGTAWSATRDRIERSTGLALAALASEVRERSEGRVALSADGNHVVGIFPVAVGDEVNEPPVRREGLLCAWLDLSEGKLAARARIRERSILLALAFALAGLGAVALLELGVFRPLARLASAAERIAAGSGDAELPRGNVVREVEQLAGAFQHMLSERSASEQRAKDSERLLRTAIDAAPCSIALVDSEGVLLLGNARLAASVGRPIESVIGRRVEEIFHPEVVKGIARWRRAALESGSPVTTEERLPLPHGGEPGQFLVQSAAIDVAGKPCVLYVVVNVTERARAERERRQAQRLEAVGRLAAGVAHDFNNFLTIVLNNAAEIEALLPEGDGRRAAREITQAGERASLITRHLLSFTGSSREESAIADLGELVRRFEPLLRSLVGEDVRVVTRVERRPWPVQIAAIRVEQVLLNLASNARDAMPSGGKLEISVGPSAGQAEAKHGFVDLDVRDTGAGMTPEVLERAFEPFFTTKPIGRGTGLGLSTSREIIEQAGGSLRIESELGRGTRVQIRLPVASERTIATQRAESAEQPRGGSETVLVIEDDPNILNLIARTLRSRGYRCLTAHTGGEALRIASQDPFALVIADVVLPGRSGFEIASELRRARPGLKLLFISGYGEEATKQGSELGVTAPTLAKPFTPRSLLRAVRDALDDGRSPA